MTGVNSPDLDAWAPDPTIRISHGRDVAVDAESLWSAAHDVRLKDARLLGRLISWRVAGVDRSQPFGEFFRSPPFVVLDEGDHHLLSGVCGRIWVVRGGLAELEGPEQFRDWSQPGTVRVLFANWVSPVDDGRSRVSSEVRVVPVDARGGSGLRLVRPIVRASQHLIAAEGLRAAARRAERAAR